MKTFLKATAVAAAMVLTIALPLGAEARDAGGSFHGGGNAFHGGAHAAWGGSGWHGGYYHGGYYRGGYYGGYWGPGAFWGGLGLGLGIGSIAYYDNYGYGYDGYYPAAPGYVVAPGYALPPVAAPTDAPAPQPGTRPTGQAVPLVSRAPDPIFYPKNGQSVAKTDTDRQECNRWATTQAGAMNDASIFQRATFACMEGRGYVVR